MISMNENGFRFVCRGLVDDEIVFQQLGEISCWLGWEIFFPFPASCDLHDLSH